jgi:hypothetical protein
MDFDIIKWTGFLVNFAWTITKDKEVPIHVYEHTLSRLGFAMPAARVYPTVVSDTRQCVARLGDVLEQANGVRGVSNHPGRYADFAQTTASLRPFLQLFQSFRVDRPRLGPPGCRGRGRPAQPARLAVPGRRRHAVAQARQTRLWLGVVPRCRGLDGQASGHRQRQQLGGDGIGDLHPRDQQDLLSSDPCHAASGGQDPQERIHVGQGNAPGHLGMVPRAKAGFARRRGVFDEKLARGVSIRE